jgi:hypothetical protein
MKIKVTTTTTKTKEVEIDFPYYSGDPVNGCHVYKVVDEDNIILVCNLKGHERIEKAYIDLALKEKPCTKEVFDKAFTQILKALSI